jgi:hypothetical protein
VTIPATVPQGSEIPEGLMNNPVLVITSAATENDCSYFKNTLKCFIKQTVQVTLIERLVKHKTLVGIKEVRCITRKNY